MSKKILIFDFDGTLANTLDAMIEITNRFSDEFGYKKINDEAITKLRNLTSREIIKTSKIPLVKIPTLIHLIKNELNHNLPKVKPIEGIDSVLKTLKIVGYDLGIVSSNYSEIIHHFIQINQWNDLFKIICCGATIFGKAKVLHKLLHTQNLSPKQVVYFGDESRDIDAAKKVNIPVVGVSWGFNSRSVLAAHHPDFLIDRPAEILDVISQL